MKVWIKEDQSDPSRNYNPIHAWLQA